MIEEKTKTEKPKYKICEECGERVKAQGYGGHLFLKHDIKIGVGSKLNDVKSRLDKVEKIALNNNGNPGDETIEDLSEALKNATERIEILENFISRIMYDPEDTTLWMKAKSWEKYSVYKDNDEDDEEDEKNPDDEDDEEEEKNPDDDEEEEKEDNPEKKKKGFWSRLFSDDDEEDDEENKKNPDDCL